jgi:alpha-amylase
MARKQANLLLLWQHRQPVGNLPGVFDQAFVSCYERLLAALEARPGLRINLYYAGPLLEYFEEKQPEFLDRLQKLVAEGRVEVLAGAFYEPILSELSEEDRRGQIELSKAWWRDRMGLEVSGFAMPPGGVWVPSLAASLHKAGMRYTILNHERFAQAGIKEAGFTGYYITEHLGKTLAVFPNHPTLRRLLPYQSLDESFGFLRRLANRGENASVTLADHAERWGFWGESGTSVLQSGYLQKFLERLEASSDWLKTRRISDYLEECEPRGKVYPVPGVNWEMGAWSMSTERRKEFFLARKNLEQRFDAVNYLPFFQAGSFSAFRQRYPEGNQMWGKCLFLAEVLSRRSTEDLAVQRFLWKAQGNSVYWYAASGGIYLPHLREAAWRNLLSAERLLRAGQVGWSVEQWDLNTDGSPDVIVSHPKISTSFDVRYGGGCMEMSFLPLGVNVANVLSRKSEDLSEPSLEPHSRVGWGLENAPAAVEDWQRRLLFQDHWFARGTTADELTRLSYVELGDFVDRPYRVDSSGVNGEGAFVVLSREGGIYRNGVRQPLMLAKAFQWNQDASMLRVRYSLKNIGVLPLEGMFASEMNLFLSSDTLKPDQFSVGNEELPTAETNQKSGVETVRAASSVNGLSIEIKAGSPAEVWIFPLFSFHRVEGQEQRLRQGNSVWMGWHETIAAGGESIREIEWKVSG